MAKFICVIARDRPDLYAEVADDFRDDPIIRVIVDRRVAERRLVPMTPGGGVDRRRADRRTSPPSQNDLATLGYVLVRAART